MKIQLTKKTALGFAFGLAFVVAVPQFAGAISMQGTSTLREETQKLREEKKQQATDARDAKKAALCESRKERINQVMERINDRSQRVYDRLTKISELLQKYYGSNNLSIDNYEALVADINVKRSMANTKLNVMLTYGSFSCDESSPRQAITDYRDSRKAKVTAMKAYRQAVKTLLTEIKAAVSANHEQVSAQTDGGAQ